MRMQRMKIRFIAKIDTKDEINKLFEQKYPSVITKLENSISPVLYQINLEIQMGESMAFRTHDQVARFLRKCSDKNTHIKAIYEKEKAESIRNQAVLNMITQIEGIQTMNWFKQFFEFSAQIKGKSYSCVLKKQSGGRYKQFNFCQCCKWKDCRIYVVKDGIITYNQKRNIIQQFLIFGKDFAWEVSQTQQNLIYIHSYHRKMTLWAYSDQEFFTFLFNLQNFIHECIKQQTQYRFNSFAPLRQKNSVEFFIDGADYFQAIANGIQSAEEEVYICGWWVSPQFSLRRPCEGINLDYRLDNLLARTAKKGVKIYIIVYYESTFLTNNSAYTIQALEQLSSNIRVLRHPQIVLPTYWSHHQKMVVIDQCLAFTGGLDLCYGRYDTQEHLINHNDPNFYPGIEYNNCRINDFVEVNNFKKENVERTQPRLPWHDVAMMLKGVCVKDLSRHFIEYWNYTSYETHYTGRYVLVSNERVVQTKKNNLFEEVFDFAKARIRRRSSFQNDQKNHSDLRQMCSDQISDQLSENKIIPKVPLSKKINNVFSNFFERKNQDLNSQSMKDKEASSRKDSPSSQLIYRTDKLKDTLGMETQIQEIDYIPEKGYTRSPKTNRKKKREAEENDDQQIKERNNIEKKQKMVQETYKQIEKIRTKIQEQEHIEEKAQGDYLQERSKKIEPLEKPNRISFELISKTKDTLANKLFGTTKKPDMARMEEIQFSIEDGYTCQVLRSSSLWSIGSKFTEKSIYDAYIFLIQKSEKYIYIENQFFISATLPNGVVKNKIMQAIYERIKRAIENKQNFKVLVMMPLVPGFAGELDNPSASLPRVIMNWQYKTICRGDESLLGRLSKITQAPEQYIRFFGLRTHGIIKERAFTEIIYLHSKLMIVDDKKLICGSANINDRSMEGNRDSQLCVLVEGDCNKQLIIEKQKFRVVSKIHQIRSRLWSEHFGISEIEAKNPVSSAIWSQISKIAKNNTEIYRVIFGCYPDDQIQNLATISKFKKQTVNLDVYQQESLKIKGHAVQFPFSFLSKEILTSYHPNVIST